MIDLRTKTGALRAEILGLVHPKLLFQFKRPSKVKKLSSNINSLILNRMEELAVEIRTEYQFWIPIPTANFKTRLKFLLTGKLN